MIAKQSPIDQSLQGIALIHSKVLKYVCLKFKLFIFLKPSGVDSKSKAISKHSKDLEKKLARIRKIQSKMSFSLALY